MGVLVSNIVHQVVDAFENGRPLNELLFDGLEEGLACTGDRFCWRLSVHEDICQEEIRDKSVYVYVIVTKEYFPNEAWDCESLLTGLFGEVNLKVLSEDEEEALVLSRNILAPGRVVRITRGTAFGLNTWVIGSAFVRLVSKDQQVLRAGFCPFPSQTHMMEGLTFHSPSNLTVAWEDVKRFFAEGLNPGRRSSLVTTEVCLGRQLERLGDAFVSALLEFQSSDYTLRVAGWMLELRRVLLGLQEGVADRGGYISPKDSWRLCKIGKLLVKLVRHGGTLNRDMVVERMCNRCPEGSENGDVFLTRLHWVKDAERLPFQVRIHLFGDARESVPHNHNSNVMSMCLSGEYQHTSFELEDTVEERNCFFPYTKAGIGEEQFLKKDLRMTEQHLHSKGNVYYLNQKTYHIVSCAGSDSVVTLFLKDKLNGETYFMGEKGLSTLPPVQVTDKDEREKILQRVENLIQASSI